MVAGIGKYGRGQSGTPASYFAGLAAQIEEGKEGNKRGGSGLYRGCHGASIGALNRSESRAKNSAINGLGRDPRTLKMTC